MFTFLHRDGDSVFNDYDNCVNLPNAEQADKDNDLKGWNRIQKYRINLQTRIIW